MNGILNIDKPEGLSSARVVALIKRLLPRGTKVGHAGTLDPFATGVLLVLVGKATKLCERLMDSPKQYLATIRLGATTATDDPEAPEVPFPDAAPPPTLEKVTEAIGNFVGVIRQRPPAFSAMKIGGHRAYDLSRRGEDVRLEPRNVVVYAIVVLGYEWPTLDVRIDCGRGTYIRSLARDLGDTLRVGGHLTALRRTRVGDFCVEQASPLESLTPSTIESLLTPINPSPGKPWHVGPPPL